jgi:hypothetical protein
VRRQLARRALGVSVAALLAVAASAAGADGPIFQPYQAIDVGSWPAAVAVGDVTGDRRPDVVMTTNFKNQPAADFRLWVFAQTPDGTLAQPISYGTAGSYGAWLDSAAVGDITGDGRSDVLLGVDGVGVQLFPQLPSGMLGSPRMFPTLDGRLVRTGHLDGDGQLDVAAVGWGTNSVSVLLNDGAGGLRAPVKYPATHAGYDDLEIGDVTGDGRDDLVVMSGQLYAAPNVSVLRQLATGGFGLAAAYRVGPNILTHGIGVGDVTGDGRNDVVASHGGNRPSSHVAIFPQMPSGVLGEPTSHPSYDIPEPVEVTDVDFDGREDIVTAHGGWLEAGVYRQLVGGGVAGEELYPIPYASHYGPHGLAVGDVNGDGPPDLVLADYNFGLVILYHVGYEPYPTPSLDLADLAVDVTASASEVRRRESFWFDVAVSNRGPDASPAELTVELSGSPSNLSVDHPGCSFAGLTVACSFSSLAAGSSQTVRITGFAPSRKGSLDANALVDGLVQDPDETNDRDSASIIVR